MALHHSLCHRGGGCGNDGRAEGSISGIQNCSFSSPVDEARDGHDQTLASNCHCLVPHPNGPMIAFAAPLPDVPFLPASPTDLPNTTSMAPRGELWDTRLAQEAPVGPSPSEACPIPGFYDDPTCNYQVQAQSNSIVQGGCLVNSPTAGTDAFANAPPVATVQQCLPIPTHLPSWYNPAQYHDQQQQQQQLQQHHQHHGRRDPPPLSTAAPPPVATTAACAFLPSSFSLDMMNTDTHRQTSVMNPLFSPIVPGPVLFSDGAGTLPPSYFPASHPAINLLEQFHQQLGILQGHQAMATQSIALPTGYQSSSRSQAATPEGPMPSVAQSLLTGHQSFPTPGGHEPLSSVFQPSRTGVLNEPSSYDGPNPSAAFPPVGITAAPTMADAISLFLARSPDDTSSSCFDAAQDNMSSSLSFLATSATTDPCANRRRPCPQGDSSHSFSLYPDERFKVEAAPEPSNVMRSTCSGENVSPAGPCRAPLVFGDDYSNPDAGLMGPVIGLQPLNTSLTSHRQDPSSVTGAVAGLQGVAPPSPSSLKRLRASGPVAASQSMSMLPDHNETFLKCISALNLVEVDDRPGPSLLNGTSMASMPVPMAAPSTFSPEAAALAVMQTLPPRTPRNLAGTYDTAAVVPPWPVDCVPPPDRRPISSSQVAPPQVHFSNQMPSSSGPSEQRQLFGVPQFTPPCQSMEGARPIHASLPVRRLASPSSSTTAVSGIREGPPSLIPIAPKLALATGPAIATTKFTPSVRPGGDFVMPNPKKTKAGTLSVPGVDKEVKYRYTAPERQRRRGRSKQGSTSSKRQYHQQQAAATFPPPQAKSSSSSVCVQKANSKKRTKKDEGAIVKKETRPPNSWILYKSHRAIELKPWMFSADKITSVLSCCWKIEDIAVKNHFFKEARRQRLVGLNQQRQQQQHENESDSVNREVSSHPLPSHPPRSPPRLDVPCTTPISDKQDSSPFPCAADFVSFFFLPDPPRPGQPKPKYNMNDIKETFRDKHREYLLLHMAARAARSLLASPQAVSSAAPSSSPSFLTSFSSLFWIQEDGRERKKKLCPAPKGSRERPRRTVANTHTRQQQDNSNYRFPPCVFVDPLTVDSLAAKVNSSKNSKVVSNNHNVGALQPSSQPPQAVRQQCPMENDRASSSYYSTFSFACRSHSFGSPGAETRTSPVRQLDPSLSSARDRAPPVTNAVGISNSVTITSGSSQAPAATAIRSFDNGLPAAPAGSVSVATTATDPAHRPPLVLSNDSSRQPQRKARQQNKRATSSAQQPGM